MLVKKCDYCQEEVSIETRPMFTQWGLQYLCPKDKEGFKEVTKAAQSIYDAMLDAWWEGRKK